MADDVGNAGKLAELRKAMASRGVRAIIVPSQDPHFSEYVAACFERRRWISEFTGSAGTVVVTDDEALLWTDGRYFVQAEEELSEDWTLMRSGTKGTPDAKTWLKTTMAAGSAVGIDPNVHSVSEARELRKALKESECEVVVSLTSRIRYFKPPFSEDVCRNSKPRERSHRSVTKFPRATQKYRANGTGEMSFP